MLAVILTCRDRARDYCEMMPVEPSVMPPLLTGGCDLKSAGVR